MLRLLLLLNLLSNSAQALTTSYLQLQEPQGWACEQTNSVWLCRSKNKLEMKESFLVIKAKLAGRNDNIDTFYESLKNPLPLVNATSNSALSKVYEAKTVQINNHPWVKSVHLNSITQNYFTEYLVTVVGDLAIGIEFNYHQTRYKKYQRLTNDIANSIRLIDNIASTSQPPTQVVTSKPQPQPPKLEMTASEEATTNGSFLRNNQLYVLLLLGLVVIVLSTVIGKKL